MSDELNFNAPNAAATTATDDSSERRAQITALLRGRLHWAIILALIFAPLLGYLAYKSVVPMYKSTGAVTVEVKSILGSIDDLGMDKWVSFLRQQEQLLTSEAVAERAMANPEWLARGEDAAPWSAADFSSGVSSKMDEKNPRNNYFVIYFEAPDGVTAGAGNRALLEAYKDEFAFQTENDFRLRIASLSKVIDDARIKMNRYLANRRVIMTDGEYDQMERKLAALQKQQLELKFQLDAVRAELEARNPVGAGLSTNPSDLLVTDPKLAELQGQKEGIEDLIDMNAGDGRGPAHPQVKRLISQRDVIVSRIEERMEILQSGDTVPLTGDNEYDNMRRLEQTWHRQLVNVEAELEKLGAKKSEVVGIEQQIASVQDTAEDAEKRINKINIELSVIKEAVEIRGKGVNQTEPDNLGKAKQMAVLGSLGGVFLGFGLVMGLGLMDRRLRNAGDARMGMGNTRMLGILPTLPENFADPEQSERAAHAVHHIRTLLQISNRGTARVFSVTSPAAGSGKSSLSVALGLSFAASESKTLVIDCDMVGAGLTRRVGAVVNRSVEAILREDTVLNDDQINEAVKHAREKGVNLKDALIELGMLTKKDLQRLNRRQADSALGVLDACQGRPFSECVANTGIDNFAVLPIGAAKPQDAGLLSPAAIRNLIARAREEYDIVLIDTGPCLGSLEASMAAAESDATVLIVSRGDSKAMATKAREHLVSVGANVVGVVFNHALENDMNSSSFASIVSQERRTDPAQSLLSADPAVAARFGPLGSAVAAFGTPSKSPNGRHRAAVATANGSSNGH